MKKGKVFLILILALSLVLRILFLWKYSASFTYDQGRDLLEIREMVVLKKIRLIGPTTSLHGVFSGPFWYWMGLPFYLLTNGHPLSTEFILIALSFLFPIFVYFLVSDKRLALILSSVYIFSQAFFQASSVALNTNPMVFVMPLILLCLTKFFLQEEKKFLCLTMFLIGSCFHFEAIIGLLMLPFLLIAALIFKKTKLFLRNKEGLLVFFIPLVPQLFFELRHNLIQIKTVFTLVSGKGSSLTPASGDLVFRFFDRLKIFKNVFIFNASGNPMMVGVLLILIIILIGGFLKAKTKRKNEIYYLGLLTLLSWITIFFGFVFYPYALWPWYLGAVDALMLTLVGLALFSLFLKSKAFGWLAYSLLLIFVILNIAKYWPWPLQQESSPDPANLRNRLEVVDLIYDDVQNQGMNIFTFAPYVYDYPYQYLIWWRAKEKYGYLPEEFAYLPRQPDYVAAKSQADALIPKKEAKFTYLIIEPFESQQDWFWQWRGNFPQASSEWEIGKTKVEKILIEIKD